MLKTMIAPALAVLLLAGAGPAGAAVEHDNPDHMNFSEFMRCESLAKKFDDAVDKHQTAKDFARAKQLRSEGMEECMADDYMRGIHSLEQALLDINVTPGSVNYF